MIAKELHEKLLCFSTSYFLPDLRNDKNDFYSLTEEDFSNYWTCIGGYVLNLFLDGEIDKANEIIEKLPKNNIMRLGLNIVNPSIDFKGFVKTLNYLKETNIHLGMVVLTAGRPYLLNGYNDFTRLGSFLLKYKDSIIEDIQFLYGTECASFIYNLSFAEYLYYQKSSLVDAELIVSSTIKSFDKNNEFKFLFSALFLEAKIALANGTILKSSSFIKDIKQRVSKMGKVEFANNIDAAEVYFSFYSGDYELISKWMRTDAPDEISDFNMLDLYRYMIKIRCYIVQEEQSTAIALIEKLRPILEIGRRYMDLCEIDLLMAEALWSAGKEEPALNALGRALKIAERRNYLRLTADEGAALFGILLEYIKTVRVTPFLENIIELTRRMAIFYPLYLKPRHKNNEHFSQMEVDILNLLQQGKSYDEIGEYFFISLNTVKYHTKKIYSKLQSSNANQAVWKAKLIGLIK